MNHRRQPFGRKTDSAPLDMLLVCASFSRFVGRCSVLESMSARPRGNAFAIASVEEHVPVKVELFGHGPCTADDGSERIF